MSSSALSIKRFGARVPASRSSLPGAWLVLLACVLALGGCATPPPPQKSQAELDALKRVRFEDTPAGARAILDESILFDTGKTELLATSDTVFEVLMPVFAKARGKIVVEGHADGRGLEAKNRELSERRALSVKNALIARKVAPDRIDVKGYGSSVKRRNPEITEEDWRLNRRAEFLFPGETVASLDGRQVEKRAETALDQLAKALNDAKSKVGDFLGNIKKSIEGGQP